MQSENLSRFQLGTPGRGRLTVRLRDIDITYRTTRTERSGRFGSGRTMRIENQVLHGVSFDAFAGELIGVIGTNGSGKSTLLKAIGGFVPLRRGTLQVAGRPRLLAVGSAMKPSMSGWENIMLGCLALGFRHEEVSDLVDEVAEFCELGSKLDLPMGNLSSGEKSRLQFGVATIRPPEILMIDEALSVGDTGFKAKSLHRLGEVLDRSGTVFFVSHNLNEITNLCNRAMWLHDGRLVANGHSQWVVDRYVEFVESDADDRMAADQVRRYRSWREENRPTGT